jgi:hypothetical protein
MTRKEPMSDRAYWLWSTHPLQERIEALTPGFSGWWTCHEDTKQGDLILVYLSRQAGHIAYLVEAASDAYLDEGSEWGGWDCEYRSLIQFTQPLSIRDMKNDRMLANEFAALKGNFQQRVYSVPADVWSHLTRILVSTNPAAKAPLRRAERNRVSKAVLLEEEIEDALETKLRVLKPEWNLELEERQFVCSGLGRIDLLCRDKQGPVIIELKRGRATGEAAAQIQAYMGWIRENKALKREKVRGIVISEDYDPKFQFAMSVVPGLHHVRLDSISKRLGL